MKNCEKGAWLSSRDLLFKFWDSTNISRTAEDTKLKYYMRIDRKRY